MTIRANTYADEPSVMVCDGPAEFIVWSAVGGAIESKCDNHRLFGACAVVYAGGECHINHHRGEERQT